MLNLNVLKRKKLCFVCLAVVIFLIICGIAIAYLTAYTPAKTNTFTMTGSNIAISLAEPKWDNLDYDGNPAGITDPLGINQAQNFVPGREIPKNPSVKNTSPSNTSEWIAIKLDYIVGISGGTPDPEDTYAELDTFADIDWNVGGSPGWEAKDSSMTVFYYNVPVAQNANTTDLLNKITIQNNVGFDQLHSFSIRVKAYAVQSEGLTYAAAKTELDNLIAANP